MYSLCRWAARDCAESRDTCSSDHRLHELYIMISCNGVSAQTIEFHHSPMMTACLTIKVPSGFARNLHTWHNMDLRAMDSLCVFRDIWQHHRTRIR